MNETRKVIGIDFGSSQSSISMMTIGSNVKPVLLDVKGGRNGQTMPTVLALDKNDDSLRAAGNDVKLHFKEVADSSCQLVSDFKRYLGSTPTASDTSEIIELRRDSEKYARIFLQEMARVVERQESAKRGELSPDSYVTCIAYPASWSDDQVRLLKKIVEDAGFPADPDRGIYSLPEPVAAVHALRMEDALGFHFGSKPERFMVIDFGGGTLDVCIIKTDILGRAPTIMATAGDPELGGKEFDDMVERIFYRNNSDRLLRDSLSPIARFEVKEQIKIAKEAASEHFLKGEDHTHVIKTVRGDYELHLYRNEFANMVKDAGVYDKIKTCIHKALNQADIVPEQISKVILTGGSSRWFFLREIVAKEFTLCGDRIFLTDTPFTDVATGCAVSVGLSNQAPKKDGMWVRWRLSENEPWSKAKCLLAPGRNESRENMGVQYLCMFPETRYFHSRRIYLSWWHGFEETNLEQIGSEAVIDAFCRSNLPWFGIPLRLRNLVDAFLLRPTSGIEDCYKVYLQYREDAADNRTYWFEIADYKESEYDKIKTTQGVDAAKKLPRGLRQSGKISNGEHSYQGLFGLNPRKIREWPHQVSPSQNVFKMRCKQALHRLFRNPFKK